MTREQRRVFDALWAALQAHRTRHGCAEVLVPVSDGGEGRWMGPACPEAAKLLGFVSHAEADFEHLAVCCAICGNEMPTSDRLPVGEREAHFACLARAELARTRSPKISLVVGRNFPRPATDNASDSEVRSPRPVPRRMNAGALRPGDDSRRAPDAESGRTPSRTRLRLVAPPSSAGVQGVNPGAEGESPSFLPRGAA